MIFSSFCLTNYLVGFELSERLHTRNILAVSSKVWLIKRLFSDKRQVFLQVAFYLISGQYKRNEVQTRLAFIYMSNVLASSFSVLTSSLPPTDLTGREFWHTVSLRFIRLAQNLGAGLISLKELSPWLLQFRDRFSSLISLRNRNFLIKMKTRCHRRVKQRPW